MQFIGATIIPLASLTCVDLHMLTHIAKYTIFLPLKYTHSYAIMQICMFLLACCKCELLIGVANLWSAHVTGQPQSTLSGSFCCMLLLFECIRLYCWLCLLFMSNNNNNKRNKINYTSWLAMKINPLILLWPHAVWASFCGSFYGIYEKFILQAQAYHVVCEWISFTVNS